MQQFILNNVNLTIAKILTQSLFILTLEVQGESKKDVVYWGGLEDFLEF